MNTKIKNISYSWIVVTGVLFMSGCADHQDAIKYEDPGTAQSLTLNFDLPDVNAVTDSIVESMLSSSAVQNLPSIADRPILMVDKIQNRTDQHIDTVSVTDSIRTRLIQSGKFRFTDSGTRQTQTEELEFQNSGELVDKNKAIALGKQYGARYVVTGAIVSYITYSDYQRAKAYKVTLNLIDLETGFIEWAGETPILKSQRIGKR